MGLRDDIQADLAEAFSDADGLADAVTSFSGSRVAVSDTLDPVSGTYPETTTAYSGRGVFGSYRAEEADGEHILRTDVKLIALQNEITRDSDGAQYEPQVDDVIAGYDVIHVGKDPAGASWTLQLRRT